MLHGKKGDNKEIFFQELHLQLEKGVRKLYITMQHIKDVIFIGMPQNIKGHLGNISVNSIGMDLQKQRSLICLLKW